MQDLPLIIYLLFIVIIIEELSENLTRQESAIAIRNGLDNAKVQKIREPFVRCKM
jgi:hypothetical protein